MHSDVPPADGAAPLKNTFTVSGTGTAPPAPIRRGRGTFSRQLRTEDIEKQQQRLQQQRETHAEVASSIATSATTAVVLQPTALHNKTTANGMMAPEDEAAAPNAQAKRNIPLEPSIHANPAASLAAAAAAAMSAATDPKSRELFGVYHEEPADTTRQLFFRGEKRKRYCMIVGNLQSTRRLVSLKLFGHRGLKPFKLQGKMIRLINLSVGRPRTRKPLLNPDGTQRVDEHGEVMVGEFEEVDDSDEEEEQEEGDGIRNTEGGATAATQSANVDEPPTLSSASVQPASYEKEDEDLAAQRRAHEAAGFPAEGLATSERPPQVSMPAPQGFQPPRNIDDDDDDPTAFARPVVAAQPPAAPSADKAGGDAAQRRVSYDSRASGSGSGGAAQGASVKSQGSHPVSAPQLPIVEIEDEEEDVDHYFEREDDDVVPLTVQRNDEDGNSMGGEVLSLANSPVLTSKYFSSLTDYFLREFRFLLSLEDVRQQNVSVNVNLGAAYCCLARHGSHSTPLKHATFSQFVQRMNDESMQLYFIKDCPACVSRAVDRECGALDHESAITLVKIHFFSNERQSRSTARAVWDSELNAFKLLDMENVGVSFNWTVFSLDETLIRQRTEEAKKKAMALSPSAEAAAAAAAKAARAKSVAYPFEVEFRAFRRWRQHVDHPAAPLAEAILEKLSTAEHGLITHGSSSGYEHLDLSNICELDYAAEDINVESITVEHTARVKPQGTDLLVDNTTSLFIENFAAARQLKEQVAQYGPEKVLARQNASNNNFLRGRGGRGFGGRGGSRYGGGNDTAKSISAYDSELMKSVLRPASKLTFFRSRGSTIHWKFRLGGSVEENIAPMAEALRFVQQVLVTANDIERSSDRGGAAPEAL